MVIKLSNSVVKFNLSDNKKMERDTESPIDVVGINEAAALPFNLVSFHLNFFAEKISNFYLIFYLKA